MAETLRRLVGSELARRSEPWARKFVDLATGAPYDDVVAALAQVGVGLERDSVGNPLSDHAFREQLAAWLVDTVVVNRSSIAARHNRSGRRHAAHPRGDP